MRWCRDHEQANDSVPALGEKTRNRQMRTDQHTDKAVFCNESCSERAFDDRFMRSCLITAFWCLSVWVLADKSVAPLQNNPSKPVRLTLICKRFNYRGSRYRCVKPFSNAGRQFTFIDKTLSKQDAELCAEFQMKRQAAEMKGWTVRRKLTGRKRYKMLW